jgi:hypothetical protein
MFVSCYIWRSKITFFFGIMSEKGDWKRQTAGIDPKFGAQGGGPDDKDAVPIEFYAPPGSPTMLGLGAAADVLRQQGVIVRDIADVSAAVAGKVIVAQDNADPLARTIATGSSPLASTQTPVENQVPKEGGFNLLQYYYFLVGASCNNRIRAHALDFCSSV